jgi:predicted nucleotidyltransferase component of viral defense system
MNELDQTYPHNTDPDIFAEALSYSEADTGFTSTLIEKDYFCSLVLQHILSVDTPLVFKGGTCLSKVHMDFYRLSEDLDLIIPVATDTTRNQRRHKIERVKREFTKLPKVIPGLLISEAFRGHNESKQYIGCLEYQSAVIEKAEKIKVEVGLREPVIRSPETITARTIAVNPFSRQPLLPDFTINAMSLKEAYAEKLRAAMTRRDPAIRDFFDLFYAFVIKGLDYENPHFIKMVKAKLKVPGNSPVNVSDDKKSILYRQLEGQLKPVLRPADFDAFNLDKAFALVQTVSKSLSKKHTT